MIQNLTFFVYFSMTRLRAFCATWVIASASSRMMSLYPSVLNMALLLAKLLICSRTTSIPLSSEALSLDIEMNLDYFYFKNHALVLCAVNASCTSKNGASLSSSWRSVEKHVACIIIIIALLRQPVQVDEARDRADDVFV